MTMNNNKEVCVCGWCGTGISDGMEFCSVVCATKSRQAYDKDMLEQQIQKEKEDRFAAMFDMGVEDALNGVDRSPDVEIPEAAMPMVECCVCGEEIPGDEAIPEKIRNGHVHYCDTCYIPF